MTALRSATLDDIPHLQRWDRAPHVIEATGGSAGEDWPAMLAAPPADYEALIIEADGRPIGMVRFMDPAVDRELYWRPWLLAQGDDLTLGRRTALDIWIGEPDALGQGHGEAAIRMALAHAFASPAIEAVLIDPLARNSAARRFYERLGFVSLGPWRFAGDDCVVYHYERRAS